MKARIIWTFQYDYEIDPDYYPECNSWEEALATDVENIDPVAWLDAGLMSEGIEAYLVGTAITEPWPEREDE